MVPAESALPQGALGLLILKVAALGPVNGCAIARRLDTELCLHLDQHTEGLLAQALLGPTGAVTSAAGRCCRWPSPRAMCEPILKTVKRRRP
jgi:hypothetical protein